MYGPYIYINDFSNIYKMAYLTTGSDWLPYIWLPAVTNHYRLIGNSQRVWCMTTTTRYAVKPTSRHLIESSVLFCSPLKFCEHVVLLSLKMDLQINEIICKQHLSYRYVSLGNCLGVIPFFYVPRPRQGWVFLRYIWHMIVDKTSHVTVLYISILVHIFYFQGIMDESWA
jgi:hypothetical protein